MRKARRICTGNQLLSNRGEKSQIREGNLKRKPTKSSPVPRGEKGKPGTLSHSTLRPQVWPEATVVARPLEQIPNLPTVPMGKRKMVSELFADQGTRKTENQ